MGFKTLIECKLFVLASVAFLLIVGSPSLSKAVETSQTSAQSIRRNVEMDALKKAQSAFDAGDYRGALTRFEMLGNVAQSPDIKREAMYGSATARLVLADSKEAFDSAVAAWEKWAAEAGAAKGMEDPRMLTPFIVSLQSAIKKGAGGPLGTKEKGDAPPRIVIMKEKLVQNLRAKLALAQREIRRLRHDLKSLDEIHRKYEEKKQEMTP